MADEKPLTKQDLLEALKGVATKDDLRSMESRFNERFATKEDLSAIEERTDGKLAAMSAHFEDKLAAMETRLDGKLAAMETRLGKEIKDYVGDAVETVVGALDTSVTEINQRLDKLEQNMVNKKDFNELKARVDAHYPLN